MGRTILLLDADAVFRELVSFRLKSLGYDVVGTGDSHAGLRQARRSAPAAVLLSADVPGVGRVDLLDALRQIPTLKQTPVLLLPATGSSGGRARPIRGLHRVVIGNRFQLTNLVRQLATLAEESAAAQPEVAVGDKEPPSATGDVDSAA